MYTSKYEYIRTKKVTAIKIILKYKLARLVFGYNNYKIYEDYLNLENVQTGINLRFLSKEAIQADLNAISQRISDEDAGMYPDLCAARNKCSHFMFGLARVHLK